MEILKSSGLLFILAVTVTCIQGEEQIYKVDDFGTEVKIQCTSKTIPNHSFQHWLLNDATALTRDNVNSIYELADEGLTLKIASVEESHLGDYFCVLKDDDSGTFAYFKSVVYKHERTSWEIVKTQVIVSIVAAIICAIVMVGLCLIWHYRWRPEGQDIIADYDAEGYGDQDKGHINPSWKDEQVSQEPPSIDYNSYENEPDTKF